MGRFLGRIAGTLFGLAGGLAGAIFGFFIGLLIDKVRNRNYWERSIDAFLADPPEDGGSGVPVAGSALLVALASVDGAALSENERQVHSEFSRLWPDRRRSGEIVPSLFERSRFIEPESLAKYLDAYSSQEKLHRLAKALVSVAAADSAGISRRERALLSRIASVWSINGSEMDAFERETTGLDQKARDILGVSDDVEPARLRSVYRDLVKSFHPDTAAGLDEEQQNQLSDTFLQFQEAYEVLSEQLQDRHRVWSG